MHVINKQIEAACLGWIANMVCLKPREIPITVNDKPVYLSYSDSAAEGAGGGDSLWCPDGRIIGGYIKLPDEVRSTWTRKASAGDHYDIFEIETVGPAIIHHIWSHYFEEGALWLHFIDNAFALATLVKGSS